MGLETTGYVGIEVRDGVPFIAGTATKVQLVAVNHRAFGWDGQELQLQMPHLTLGQVYAALSYYYDHQTEIDAAIAESERTAEALRPLLEDPAKRAALVDRIATARQAKRTRD